MKRTIQTRFPPRTLLEIEYANSEFIKAGPIACGRSNIIWEIACCATIIRSWLGSIRTNTHVHDCKGLGGWCSIVYQYGGGRWGNIEPHITRVFEGNSRHETLPNPHMTKKTHRVASIITSFTSHLFNILRRGKHRIPNGQTDIVIL